MGRRKRGNQEISKLTKKQKKHLKEFGEQHPFHDSVVDRPEKTQILRLPPDRPQQPEPENEEDSDEEEHSAYQKLLSTMIQGADDSSEDEVSEDDEEGEEDDEEGEEDDEIELEEEGEENAKQDDEEGKEDLEEEDEQTLDDPENKEHTEKTNGDTEEIGKGEFTDKKNDAAFCLETNLPAEGEESSEELKEDMFLEHQEMELSEVEVSRISDGSKIKTQVKWPMLGTLQCVCPLERFPAVGQRSCCPIPTIHKTIKDNLCLLNQSFQPKSGTVPDVTELQKELLGLMGTYRDVYFANSFPLREAKEVRSAYCLHALNHVLKANTRVLSNNAKLKENKNAEEDFRDQGLTRPKVQLASV